MPLLNNGKLRDGLERIKDYRVITQKLWLKLAKEYGGGPAIYQRSENEDVCDIVKCILDELINQTVVNEEGVIEKIEHRGSIDREVDNFLKIDGRSTEKV